MRAAGRADRGNPAAGETNQTAADDADATGEPPANKIELGSTNEQECPFPHCVFTGVPPGNPSALKRRRDDTVTHR
jgi:hypothetical protein